MSQASENPRSVHRHTGVRLLVLSRRAGVPYEVVRTVCSACGRVLAEQTVRRAAA